MTRAEMTPLEAEAVERDVEWGRATMLGEAVWHRIASRSRVDPKSQKLIRMHDEVVSMVRSAAFVIEQSGFEGLATWLAAESALDISREPDERALLRIRESD